MNLRTGVWEAEGGTNEGPGPGARLPRHGGADHPASRSVSHGPSVSPAAPSHTPSYTALVSRERREPKTDSSRIWWQSLTRPKPSG